MISGGKNDLSKLKKMGEILPNRPQFHFLPQEELIKLYNIADLYVHPSEVELESMSVLEAIACGLPALISDSKHSAANQFALNDLFLFKSNSVENLVAKINYWIEHEDELKYFRKQYHELSREYTINESIRKLEEVYFRHAKNRS